MGKRLVARLIESGHHVTIATRGHVADPFGDAVRRVQVDRFNEEAMRQQLGIGEWDLLFDQLCYSPDDAAIICTLFAGRIGRCVMMSSQAVYDWGIERKELDFDPYNYPLRTGSRHDFNYSEGKQLAEAVLAQQAPFPVAMVRIPVVLGEDDYTRRLHMLVESARNGTPIIVRNPNAAISLITSQEAASLLAHLADSFHQGPLNGASQGTITVEEMLRIIGQITNQTLVLQSGQPSDGFSLTAPSQSLTINTDRAKQQGIHFLPLMKWLPELIETIAIKGPR